MVKKLSKILSLFLILTVLFSNIHIVSFADDYSTEGYTTNIYEFADEVREMMTNRERYYSIKYKSKTLYTEQNQEDFTDIITELVKRAYQETEQANQGDYLKYVLSKYGYLLSGFGYGEYFYYTVDLEIQYYTSANQEQKLTQEIDKVIDGFGFTNNTPEIQKCDAIYDYITENVRYDYANLYDDEYLLKYTAYAALINKTAVCQGYATLFYRMAKECGLDVRVISGTSRGEGHAWNIVKLGDWYYYLDSTWDEGTTDYDYYLKGSNDFDQHNSDQEFKTAEFKAAYPINTLNFEDFCEHDFSIPATCTKGVVCSLCGKESPYSSSLGHSFTNYVYDEGTATCIKDGKKTAVCDREGCQATKTITAPGTALGHSFINYIYNEGTATCTSNGTKTAKCERCIKTETITAEGTMLSHHFINYVPNGDATCVNNGSKTAFCDYGCGTADTVLDEGSKTSHNFVGGTCQNCGYENCEISGVHKYSEPTCKTPGVCYLCNLAIDPEHPQPVGHDYQDYRPDDFATCETNATKTGKCVHCDKVDTKEIDGTVLGHNFINYKYDNNATCTADGTKTAKCERCSKTDTLTVENTKLKHTYTPRVVTPATCKTTGIMNYKCSCGDNYNKVIPKTNVHNYAPFNNKATYAQAGSSGNVCTVCGSKANVKVIPKLVPKTTKISKLTAKKKSLVVKIKRNKSVTGYEIQYSLKKNFKSAKKVTLKKNSSISKTIKKLKSKKTYYVRVRTYKTYNGKKYYSAWSKAVKKKTK
ncbi:MAG: hypothetical protein E7537_03880 [Ruminococcaceae bacterium]|nr:hypothetical protein [Oscillospiraceae bacterium]